MRPGICATARLGVIVVATMAIAAGCGGGAPSASSTTQRQASAGGAAAAAPAPANLKQAEAAVADLAPAQREQKLRALAKAEGGRVNVDTSLSDLVVAPLEQAWKKSHPDVKLKLYRASSEDVTARVLAERDANRSGADLVETNGTNMVTFQNRRNVLVPYGGGPNAGAIPKRYRFPTFTADRVEKFTIAWNSKLVKDPPKSFADLADPKWSHKLAMEPTDVDWFAAIYDDLKAHGGPGGAPMDQAKLDSAWQAIARNSQMINGHTDQANALAAGQVQVLVSGHAQSIEQLEAKHAPVTFEPIVAPVIERPQGIGLVYGLKHPAGAMLFYDWLLSPTGQKVLQSNGVEAANPKFPDAHFASHPRTVALDPTPVVARYKQWQAKYESFTNAPSS
ncbi:MAG: iron(III) transport system substrate-binding protein [Solirubrobacteraceae bacterium]|jgi:iron(III) transport system substrate-binding protein|nr:iron(III) transport system substrate-binding protein [Solirubrobacteraceae bacterium]